MLPQNLNLTGVFFKCFFEKIFLSLDFFDLSQSFDNCIVFVQNLSIVSLLNFESQIVVSSDNFVEFPDFGQKLLLFAKNRLFILL